MNTGELYWRRVTREYVMEGVFWRMCNGESTLENGKWRVYTRECIKECLYRKCIMENV